MSQSYAPAFTPTYTLDNSTLNPSAYTLGPSTSSQTSAQRPPSVSQAPSVSQTQSVSQAPSVSQTQSVSQAPSVSQTPSVSSYQPTALLLSTPSNTTITTNVVCSTNPQTQFTFTITPNDMGVLSLDSFWNVISNNLNIKSSLSAGYTFSPYGTPITLPMNLSANSKNEMWLFVASLFSIFQFNLARICNVNMVPSDTSNIQSILVTGTLSNTKSNNYPNDNLSSQCLMMWINSFLQSYNPINPGLFSSTPPKSITSNPMCSGSTFIGDIKETFTNLSYLNKLNIKFTNIDMVKEDFTGVSIVSASSATPYTILDYVFLYAYPVSFIGAMLFSIMQYISIKPVTIIGNDQAVIVINAYIAICGFLSFIYWYQAYNFTSFNQFIDDISWIYNLQTIKPTSNS
jgi:hypothetical protein